MLRYERHTIRQANLFSIEWRLPHVAATVRRRAIGPGSERRWPAFCCQMVFDYYIYEDAILNCPCLLGCPINISIFPMNKMLLATYAGSGLEISQCSGTESMSDWRGILRTEDIKFVRFPFDIANRTRSLKPRNRARKTCLRNRFRDRFSSDIFRLLFFVRSFSSEDFFVAHFSWTKNGTDENLRGRKSAYTKNGTDENLRGRKMARTKFCVDENPRGRKYAQTKKDTNEKMYGRKNRRTKKCTDERMHRRKIVQTKKYPDEKLSYENTRDEKMRDEKLRDENLRTKKCQTKKCQTKNGPDTGRTHA